jgi:hypothetical protein
MKKTLFILPLVLIVAVACVSNRLEKSLATRTTEPDRRPVLTAPPPGERSLQPQLGEAAAIDPDEIVTLLPPDAIPAVLPDDVPGIMVTAAEAEEVGLDPAVRVLGVSINGEHRAYPIPFLSSHEIVNDEVGGELIAATW